MSCPDPHEVTEWRSFPGLVETKDETGLEKDKFDRLEEWLTQGGASFPKLYMKRYSENNRGVHCRVNVPNDTRIMSIPLKFLITVEMGKDTAIGRQVSLHVITLDAISFFVVAVAATLLRWLQ